MNKYNKHIIAVLVSLVLNVIYFNPLFSPDKKVIYQSDKINYKGMSKEIFDHRDKHNEDPLWTNSMFSGMPAYQISVQWKGNLLKYMVTYHYNDYNVLSKVLHALSQNRDLH